MKKKKARKGKARGKRSRRIAASAYHFATTIVVGPGNTITNPDPIVTVPGGPVVWFIWNTDADDHVVTIDPGKMKKKDPPGNGNPFPKGAPKNTVPVASGDVEVISTRTDPKKTTAHYKYAIESRTPSNGTTTTLDPDLDVDPPPIIVS